jgi:hypothetical protein
VKWITSSRWNAVSSNSRGHESATCGIAAIVHEGTSALWREANRYLDMSLLTEMKKKAVMELVV